MRNTVNGCVYIHQESVCVCGFVHFMTQACTQNLKMEKNVTALYEYMQQKSAAQVIISRALARCHYFGN